MSTDPPLSLLQFADGLFPSGGYAHSFGLEYYVQAGQVRDPAGVEAFIRAHLEGTAGPCDAVAVVVALGLGERGELDGCLALDETLEAMKPVAEFREASRQMGRQTLRVAATLTDHPLLRAVSELVEAGRTPGHHPLAFGLAGSALGWPSEAAAQAYLHSTTVLLVGAALRLLPLGQLDGQRVLWAAAPLIERLSREATGKGADDLWSFAPGIEIAGMRHAQLDARLFRS
ncbi:MAG: urease accessory protein UreF [Candidatus Rokubacteria bacterium]|nr:urease accessory protein UreF [Candidatus Rokubacteria bacterium]